MIALLLLAACHPCDPSTLDLVPLDGDWPVSTPAAEGLDPDRVDRLFCDAAREETLFGLLVARHGKLVAESYFHEGSIDQLSSRASVTKSYTSALVGQAIDEGCLSGTDAKMMDFFPELDGDITDPRKRQITVGDLLEMRSGYPWEETDPAWWDAVLSGDYVRHIVDFPLTEDPGTVHQYSNLSAHWLGVIVARACGTDLALFADEHLFQPTDTEIGEWLQDADGYTMGAFNLSVTARDMARFGQLYLDDGAWDGQQVLSSSWVDRSLAVRSEPTGALTPGPVLKDWGYGYLWWSARAGDHRVDFAWGHGGNFVFLVRDLDLSVVVTADPFLDDHFDAWPHEKAHLNLVARFLRDL
ncbi:MAG: beta-lactamase family protein [Myxococcales bacterium]|nr:beta-lactamase family protein [Myxococcales bacterium]